jgi:anti-sigma B factor antagonist
VALAEPEDAANRWQVVAVAAEVDVFSAPDLRERLLEGVTAGHHRIVLDLSAATFMHSSGFAVVVSAYSG